MILKIASAAGFVSSMCSFFQYFPQIVYNYKRKSVEGFSASSIIIKLVGASFLLTNSLFLGETVPVVLYGLSNVIAHSTFMFQFCFYVDPDKHPKKRYGYLAWIAFPFVPFLIASLSTESMAWTGMVKPISQLHLNTLCGVFGLFMCYFITPKSVWTYVLYLNSLFQASTVYLFAIIYDGPNYIKSNLLPI